MVTYTDPDLFYEHESTHLVIVNADATVTGVSEDAPTITDADFIITEEDIELEKFALEESICSEEDLTFGLCEAAHLSFTVFDRATIPNLKDIEISVYLYFDEDSSTLFKVGNYVVEEDKSVIGNDTREMSAYDIIYFLRDYDITEWYEEFFEDGQRHSIADARDDLFNWMATDVEDFTVEQETRTLINDDYEIEKSIESDTITFGFFMQGILEINGCFGHINRSGNFDYIQLQKYDESLVKTIDDDLIFPPIKYEDFNTWGIGYVAVYDRNNNLLAKVGSSDYRHPSIYNIVDSFVFTNNSKTAGWQDDLEQAVSNLREGITHRRYRSCEVNAIGNLCWEVGDRIDIKWDIYDDEGEVASSKTIQTYILERKFSGVQEFEDIYTAKGHKKQPKYNIKNDNWHVGDSQINSLDGVEQLASQTSSDDFVEIIRNIGFRLLDEPSNVSVVYDSDVPEPPIIEGYSNCILLLFKANGTYNYGGVWVYDNTYWSIFYVSNSAIQFNNDLSLKSPYPYGCGGKENNTDEYDYEYKPDSYASNGWTTYDYVHEKIFVNIKGENPVVPDHDNREYYASWEEYIQTLSESNMASVKLKWTDPPDISTNEPVPCTWAGTVVVRKEGSAPKHRWDGTLIVESTTRDEYSVTAFEDDTIEGGKTYYYGIFPYHVALDDANNPIKHYRFTKSISVTVGKKTIKVKDKWVVKTWQGLAPNSGTDVWSDGENIYYSDGSTHYVLNKETSTWSSKSWSGMSFFRGYFIWKYDNAICYSCSSEQHILNKITDTWETKTWGSIVMPFDGHKIWFDGSSYFHSDGNNQYELNRDTETWEDKQWANNKIPYNGSYVWTDGEHLYYSAGDTAQYVYDPNTGAWTNKTWNGGVKPDGEYIWTDGTNIYYSYGQNQYVLDRSTDTWEVKEWKGTLASFDGNYVWTDGTDIYYSKGSSQYVLVAEDD